MTATVEHIESWVVDVPTIRPHKLSMTTMGCQTLVIVRITRSDGICGIGEATTIGGLSYGGKVRRRFSPRLRTISHLC